MVPGIVDEFPIDDDIVLLNHASFGVPTTHLMDVVEQTRRRIERDAAGLLLPDPLNDGLRSQLAVAADFLAVPRDALALTMNATEASSAVASSLGRRSAIRVAMLDTEYPSVIRAWQVAADTRGGSVQLVQLDPPVDSPDEVLRAFDHQVTGAIDVTVVSLVTSPTALRLPIEQIAQWSSDRGAITVVDAAHAPGHLDVRVADLGASVVYGTLHKWLPVPRPLGFLYATDDLREALRPRSTGTRDSPSASPGGERGIPLRRCPSPPPLTSGVTGSRPACSRTPNEWQTFSRSTSAPAGSSPPEQARCCRRGSEDSSYPRWVRTDSKRLSTTRRSAPGWVPPRPDRRCFESPPTSTRPRGTWSGPSQPSRTPTGE